MRLTLGIISDFAIRMIMLTEEQEKANHKQWYADNLKDTYQLYLNGDSLANMAFIASETAWLHRGAQDDVVIKTESNTKESFRLHDGDRWSEWGDIDGVKDAIHSNYDHNAIVPIQKLVAVEIEQTEHYAHLTMNSRFTDIINFYDNLAEAEEAAKP